MVAPFLLAALIFVAVAEKPASPNTGAVEILSAATARASIPGLEPWVVVLHTKWCAYCRKLLPELEAAATAVPEVRFGLIDCDEESTLCGSLGLSGYPTILFWPNGTSVGGLAHPRPFRGPRTRSTLSAFAADLAHPPLTTSSEGAARCREPAGDLRAWASAAGVAGVAFLYIPPDAAADGLFGPFASVAAGLHPEVAFACATWEALRATHAAGEPVAPAALDDPVPPTDAAVASLADQLAEAGIAVGAEGLVLRLSASEGARVLVAVVRSAPLDAMHHAMHAMTGAVQVGEGGGGGWEGPSHFPASRLRRPRSASSHHPAGRILRRSSPRAL